MKYLLILLITMSLYAETRYYGETGTVTTIYGDTGSVYVDGEYMGVFYE